MKINFSKEEYRLLLEIVYLSDWMMCAHIERVEHPHKKHQVLRKKILSYFKEMDAEDIVEYSKEHDEYYEFSDLEDELNEKFIDPYNYAFFWDELIDSLARRDFINSVGVKKYQTMEFVERGMGVEKMKERYANEFQEHGLGNLKIHREDVMIN